MGFSHPKERWGFLALSVFAASFLLLGLGASPLVDWDENIYAEASRQMVERQEYLNIYVNDHPFAEKPPFFLWEQALSYHLFGIHEFAARFPSAVAGFFSVWVCFFLGRKIQSWELGVLWGLVYLTAFLPSLFARSAVIDATFNFFIMLSAYSLYAYDVRYGQWLSAPSPAAKNPAAHWRFLTLASVGMGLGVLTKGPLGGVIPLVSFGVYKWFYRTPKISWVHFIYCAVLSLTVGLSWYLINSWIYGLGATLNFLEFQKLLFTRPMEGHHAPFYYHFVVAIGGLFPWTPFLLLFRLKHFPASRSHLRPLLLMGLGWGVFVLILFSIVSTKLPHYSASIYIPLSLMVALCLERAIKNQAGIAFWIIGIYLLLGTLVAAWLTALPWLLENHFAAQNFSLNGLWPTPAYLTGIFLFLGIALASFLFFRKKIWRAVWTTAATLFLVSQGLWRSHVPLYLQYAQQPLLKLVEKAHQNQGKVVFYRYVSFAALFYGKQPIEMLHTYKFPGNPSILDQPAATDLFVITEQKNKNSLQTAHPLVEFLEDHGTFSLFLLPKGNPRP